jgi:hypothetical protein
MKIQLVIVVIKRRVGPDGQSCGQFAVNPTKKVAVFIQMPSVMFQTSLEETSERINFSPIGLVTRQGHMPFPYITWHCQVLTPQVRHYFRSHDELLRNLLRFDPPTLCLCSPCALLRTPAPNNSQAAISISGDPRSSENLYRYVEHPRCRRSAGSKGTNAVQLYKVRVAWRYY